MTRGITDVLIFLAQRVVITCRRLSGHFAISNNKITNVLFQPVSHIKYIMLHDKSKSDYPCDIKRWLMYFINHLSVMQKKIDKKCKMLYSIGCSILTFCVYLNNY